MSAASLVVDVSEALRHTGTRRPVRREVPAGDLGELELTSARVPPDTPVELDLEVEGVGADVVVTGTIRTSWQGECRRCLEAVEGELELDVREIFEPRPTEGQTYPIGEEQRIDLEPMAREAILLALPLSPLCRPECTGPDPDRFPARVEGEEGAGGEGRAVDPRWAALDQLRLEE